MHETELWITKFFNNHLADLGNSLLGLVGMHARRPWTNYITMQMVVALVIMVLFALLRPRLSVDRPGGLQHVFEITHDFLYGESEDQVGHDGPKYLGYFGTIFIFILVANLIGIVPGFEAPTMSPSVPLGCALATFCYYNYAGLRAQGVGK